MEQREIKVAVRIRPVNDLDLKQAQPYRSSSGPDICLNLKPDGQRLCLIRDAFNTREFRFDHVFGTTAATSSVYRYICEEVVNDFVSGYNASVLCYGQTGTGKTYTMFGKTDAWNAATPYDNKKCEGLVQTAFTEMFEYMNDCHKHGIHAELSISFYEIYLENVRDLLAPKTFSRCSTPSLTIRESPTGGAYVEGLTTYLVKDMAAVYDLIHSSVSRRATHELMMNKSSSRSHAILQVTLEKDAGASMHRSEYEDDSLKSDQDNSRSRRTRAMFTFGDLAGSERITKTGSNGARLNEAKMINKSISALGNCIQALAAASSRHGKDKNRHNLGNESKHQHNTHIPFRDSKLTRLLADAIGGNARTCIIATVSPCAHSYEETLSTLIFASRAATIKKEIRPVKSTPSVFSDLSTSVLEWKWPPPRPAAAAIAGSSSGRAPLIALRDRGNITTTYGLEPSDIGEQIDGSVVEQQGGDDYRGCSREQKEAEAEAEWHSEEHEAAVIRAKVQRAFEKRNLKALTRDTVSQKGIASEDYYIPSHPASAVSVSDYAYNISQEEIDPNMFTELSASRLIRVQSSLQEQVPASGIFATSTALDQSGSNVSKSGQKLQLHPTIVLKRLGESVEALSPPHVECTVEQPVVRLSSSQFMRGDTNVSAPQVPEFTGANIPKSGILQQSNHHVASLENERASDAVANASYNELSVHDLAELSNDALHTEDLGASTRTRAYPNSYHDNDYYVGTESNFPVELDMDIDRYHDTVHRTNRGGVFDDGLISALEKDLERMEQSVRSPTPNAGSHIDKTHRVSGEKTHQVSGEKTHRVSGEKTHDEENSMGRTSQQQRRHQIMQSASLYKQIHANESGYSSHSGRKQLTSSRVTIYRDFIHPSQVPPPPTRVVSPVASGDSLVTSQPKRNSISRTLQLALTPCIDHSVGTDICAVEFVDKGTNTPLASLLNPNPCPSCRMAQAEILHLRNEICRYVEDINKLKGL